MRGGGQRFLRHFLGDETRNENLKMASCIFSEIFCGDIYGTLHSILFVYMGVHYFRGEGFPTFIPPPSHPGVCLPPCELQKCNGGDFCTFFVQSDNIVNIFSIGG